MKHNTLISIVTPTYNAINDIENCITSVAGQIYQNKEHLIIDGLSNDGTVELIKRYQRKYSHIKLLSAKDDGIYDAMNKGIANASGGWIYFMGSDDVFYDSSVLHEIFADRDATFFDVIYGNVQWGNSQQTYDGKFSILKLMEKNLCHQAIFYSAGIFKKLGYFDLRYPILADYVFNIKWFSDDFIKVKYCDKIIAKFGINGESSKGIDANFLRDKDLIFRENLPPEYVLLSERLKSLEQKDQQLLDANLTIERLEAQLLRIQNSMTWRVMAPIRWLASKASLKLPTVKSCQRK